MASRIVCTGGVLALGLGLATECFAAEPAALDGETVRTAITGRTVQLETPVGTIPISFNADGTMIGRTADMANWLGRGMDRGTWWIANDQLCQKWKLWFEGQSYCFKLRQAGDTVRWTRNDGLQGTVSVKQKEAVECRCCYFARR